jgi:outer membrane protein TolC
MRRILAAALLPAAFAQAPQPQASATKPVRVIVPAQRIGIMAEAQISIEEAVALTLSNNRDIDSSRIDRQITSLRLTGARGAYDPRIGADGGWNRSITPVSSALGGGAVPGQLRTVTVNAVPQFSGLVPRTGGSYSVSFANNRNTTDSLFATLNPQFPTTLSFNLTQPLWRSLRYDDSRRQIEIAKKNISISDEQFRQRVIETATAAVNAYWDLVYAYRNYQIQMEAVDLARRQVESNQRQAEQGILAPIDIVEAQTQLDTFEQNVYTAQQALTRAENALKALMLEDRRALLWNAALIPATPPDLSPPAATLEDALKQALEMRPEIAQVQLSGEVNRANTRYFREQTRPQVDLVATYSTAGLAGEPISQASNPFTGGNAAATARINQLSALAGLPPLPSNGSTGVGVPPAFVGTYGQSLSTLGSFNYATANVGLRVSMPLRNRVAESNLAASVADSRRIANQLAQTEMRIEADVRDTMQAIDSVRARLEAAVLGRQSSEALYQSEVRKFQEGTSTVFLVLQRQTAMITARNSELRAQTDLSKAIADFERATTRTLTSRNINIQGVSTPRRNP